MKNTILFDLDGTLLPMDFNRFMELYFYHMGEFFADLIDGKTLMKYVWDATNEMVRVNDGRTNNEIFMNHFQTLIGKDIAPFEERFTAFYDASFQQVKKSTWTSQTMIKSVDLLRQKGYELVVATNPLFPMQANLHRIAWAGLDSTLFTHITSLEQNTACKPHRLFFEEVLQAIDKEPHECIMVGNDVSDDLGAQALGIETYLITDCLLNPTQKEYVTNHQGTFEQFYEFVTQLPEVHKG